MDGAWLELGARVKGTYLGNAFTGKVVDIGFPEKGDGRVYTVQSDAPIEVTKSSLMSMKRSRITATLTVDGHSIDHKGKSNGIMAIAAED